MLLLGVVWGILSHYNIDKFTTTTTELQGCGGVTTSEGIPIFCDFLVTVTVYSIEAKTLTFPAWVVNTSINFNPAIEFLNSFLKVQNSDIGYLLTVSLSSLIGATSAIVLWLAFILKTEKFHPLEK